MEFTNKELRFLVNSLEFIYVQLQDYITNEDYPDIYHALGAIDVCNDISDLKCKIKLYLNSNREE